MIAVVASKPMAALRAIMPIRATRRGTAIDLASKPLPLTMELDARRR
jgi:hypothetical protein